MDTPIRSVSIAPVCTRTTVRADDSILMSSATPLGGYERNIGEYLHRWAAEAPDRVCFAQRENGGDWRRIAYGEAAAATRAISQALIDRGLGPDRPVMILSANSIEHALLSLAAVQVGIPVVPVSPAYSLAGGDLARLRHVYELAPPGLLFVQSGRQFAGALDALDTVGRELVCVADPAPGFSCTPFASLMATRATPQVDAARAAVTPETVAKILFTSASTGLPKGVANTHRMLCANQKSAALTFLDAPAEPPVYLDWLPWHHCYGGNYNFYAYLRTGGAHFIDEGRPVEGLFAETVRNLREMTLTSYLNVPAGFAMLAIELQRDEVLRRRFFDRVQRIGYGGAGMPVQLWEQYQQLAARTVGERILFYSGWGATETSATVTTLHEFFEGTGNIGTPMPGVTLKLVPIGDKLEARVHGDIVFSGYYRRPDLTRSVFDEEGFYRIGDAVRFIEPADPDRGLKFAGRLAEDFKLQTGTWVHGTTLRLKLLDACGSIVQDLVIAGEEREYLGLMVWLNVEACRVITGDAHLTGETGSGDPRLLAHLTERLRAYNAGQRGASSLIGRFLILREPPSQSAGEINDKGYVNQRLTLERRADLVRALYATPPAAGVIVL
ncbi:MAG: feruloyl-CoA synthase [Gammaproteobacteria bacterium]